MLSQRNIQSKTKDMESTPLTQKADGSPTRGAYRAIGFSLAITFVLFLLFNALSISAIYFGVKYLDPTFCPAQPHLAKVLIAAGVLAIIQSLFEGRNQWIKSSEAADAEQNLFLNVFRIVQLGLFIWLCVMVYSIHSSVEFEPKEMEDKNYCHPILYEFSFWTANAVFILLGVGIILSCMLLGLVGLTKTNN